MAFQGLESFVFHCLILLSNFYMEDRTDVGSETVVLVSREQAFLKVYGFEKLFMNYESPSRDPLLTLLIF